MGNNLKKDWKPWQLVQYGDQGLEDVKDNFQLAIEQIAELFPEIKFKNNGGEPDVQRK